MASILTGHPLDIGDTPRLRALLAVLLVVLAILLVVIDSRLALLLVAAFPLSTLLLLYRSLPRRAPPGARPREQAPGHAVVILARRLARDVRGARSARPGGAARGRHLARQVYSCVSKRIVLHYGVQGLRGRGGADALIRDSSPAELCVRVTPVAERGRSRSWRRDTCKKVVEGESEDVGEMGLLGNIPFVSTQIHTLALACVERCL